WKFSIATTLRPLCRSRVHRGWLYLRYKRIQLVREEKPMSGTKSVGLAIIGCGDIVMTQHLPALMENRSVRIVAVCDVDPARAEAAGAICGCDYHTTDHR